MANAASPVERRRLAIRRWLEWRDARAVVADSSPGQPSLKDPLRVMLGQWWEQEGLPKIERASQAQLDQALDKITELEWNGRPYGAAERENPDG